MYCHRSNLLPWNVSYSSGFESVKLQYVVILSVVQSAAGKAATSMRFLLFLLSPGHDRNVSPPQFTRAWERQRTTYIILSLKMNWGVNETCSDNQTELSSHLTWLFESLKGLKLWVVIQRSVTRITGRLYTGASNSKDLQI